MERRTWVRKEERPPGVPGGRSWTGCKMRFVLVLGESCTGRFGVGFCHELAVLGGAIFLVTRAMVDLGVEVDPDRPFALASAMSLEVGGAALGAAAWRDGSWWP